MPYYALSVKLPARNFLGERYAGNRFPIPTFAPVHLTPQKIPEYSAYSKYAFFIVLKLKKLDICSAFLTIELYCLELSAIL